MTDSAKFYEEYEGLKVFCTECGAEAVVSDDEEIGCPNGCMKLAREALTRDMGTT